MSVKKKALERAKRLDRVGIGRVLVKAGDPAPGNRVPMEDLRDRLSQPQGREAWNGRRVRVVRVLVYEGDGALVAGCLSQSLPVGRRDLRGYSITVHEDEHEDLGPSESRPRTITQGEVDALRAQVSALVTPPVAFDPEGDEEPDGWTGEEVDRALRAVAVRDETIQDLLRRLESVAR